MQSNAWNVGTVHLENVSIYSDTYILRFTFVQSSFIMSSQEKFNWGNVQSSWRLLQKYLPSNRADYFFVKLDEKVGN